MTKRLCLLSELVTGDPYREGTQRPEVFYGPDAEEDSYPRPGVFEKLDRLERMGLIVITSHHIDWTDKGAERLKKRKGAR